MMKKICFLILVLSLVTALSCDTRPRIDPQLEKQVQIDTHQFETVLNRLVIHVGSIKSPSDVDMRPVFPDTWLFEEMPQLYALGIPIPKGLRGLVQVAETDNWTYFMIVSPPHDDWFTGGGGPFWGWPLPPIVYFNRAGKLSPATDTYIVPFWTGQPYNWGIIEGGASDKRGYPKALNPDYFKINKIATQPYMIPPEASHGVYQEPRNKASSGSAGNLVGIVRQIWDANPYLEKSDTERLKTPTIPQLMVQLSSEIAKINDDITLYLDTVKNLEIKYFIPNSSSYNKQNELADYRNSMEKIRLQLSQIDDYLQPVKKWDFSNLENYRILKTN